MRYDLDSRKVYKAIQFAKNAHKGQKRKNSSDDYFLHPISVAFLVIQYKTSKKLTDLVVAALLHDVIEDTDVEIQKISKIFGPFVAGLVLELTSNREEIKYIGKAAYLNKKLLHISGYALLIKLCDRLHNMRDNPSQKMKDDTIEIVEYLLANRSTLTRVQRELIAEILKACKA